MEAITTINFIPAGGQTQLHLILAPTLKTWLRETMTSVDNWGYGLVMCLSPIRGGAGGGGMSECFHKDNLHTMGRLSVVGAS